MGFGVGVAMGPATVGTVGYEGRIDYTAIGSVINLASRLCDSAVDTQILLDPVLADAVGKSIVVDRVGDQLIKGYDRPMRVFSSVITSAKPFHVAERGRARMFLGQ